MDWEGWDHQGSQNGPLKQLFCFSLAVGTELFQGQNWSFSALTVGMGFL